MPRNGSSSLLVQGGVEVKSFNFSGSVGLAVCLLAVGIFGTGCVLLKSGGSISDAMGSISQSVTSISKSMGSVSESSSGGKDQAARDDYRREVRNFTAIFVQSEATPEDFLQDLGRIADRHGVTDWERDRLTYVAVGAGLRQAGIDADRIRAFEASLTDADPRAVRYVREGYDS